MIKIIKKENIYLLSTLLLTHNNWCIETKDNALQVKKAKQTYRGDITPPPVQRYRKSIEDIRTTKQLPCINKEETKSKKDNVKSPCSYCNPLSSCLCSKKS